MVLYSYPTIQQPGFDLQRCSWTLPNRSDMDKARIVHVCAVGCLTHMTVTTQLTHARTLDLMVAFKGFICLADEGTVN